METKLQRVLEDLSMEEVLAEVGMSPTEALMILQNNGYIDLQEFVDELFGLPNEE